RVASPATSARGTWRRYRGSESRAARRVAARPCFSPPLRGRLWRQSSSRHGVEKVEKPGEAYSDRLGSPDLDPVPRRDPGDRAEHRDAMVSIRRDPAAVRACGYASHFEAIVAGLDADAQCP